MMFSSFLNLIFILFKFYFDSDFIYKPIMPRNMIISIRIPIQTYLDSDFDSGGQHPN